MVLEAFEVLVFFHQVIKCLKIPRKEKNGTILVVNCKNEVCLQQINADCLYNACGQPEKTKRQGLHYRSLPVKEHCWERLVTKLKNSC